MEPDQSTNETFLRTIAHAIATEVDDGVLAGALGSALELSRHPSADQPRLIALIAQALTKGGETILHAAALSFRVRTPEFSSELLDLLLDHLAKVDVANQGTLDAIDDGMSQLLQSNSVEAGLVLLERLLRSDSRNLEVSIVPHAARAIRATPALRNKVATRWLLGGDPNLCASLDRILDARVDDHVELEADAAELAAAEPVRLLFAARKAIGYLFLKPVSVAAFIVSLMGQAPEVSLREELGRLLFNPLLLNFSASISEYLRGRESSEPTGVRAVIENALEELKRYLQGLPSVGEIPALHPSLEHRHICHRRLLDEVARSFEQAQAESVLLQLVHRSVLLYGRKAIHHVFDPEGDMRRIETNLGSHGTTIEPPRMNVLDPLGLDLTLRVFRHESLST